MRFGRLDKVQLINLFSLLAPFCLEDSESMAHTGFFTSDARLNTDLDTFIWG